jgi:peptidoglycan/xylan/chitin deacetylase (PgdA/CDA1 family)
MRGPRCIAYLLQAMKLHAARKFGGWLALRPSYVIQGPLWLSLVAAAWACGIPIQAKKAAALHTHQARSGSIIGGNTGTLIGSGIGIGIGTGGSSSSSSIGVGTGSSNSSSSSPSAADPAPPDLAGGKTTEIAPQLGATHRISAEASTLLSTLEQRGWRRQDPLTIFAPACATAPPQRQAFMRLLPQTHTTQVLYLWPLLLRPHGLPAWEACVGTADAATVNQQSCASYDAAADFTEDLLSGIALLRQDGAGPGASETWVELRHAAGEIDRYITTAQSPLWCIDPRPEFEQGMASLPWMPAVAPLSDALVDTVLWRDNEDDRQVALTFDACSTFYHGAYSPAVIEALMHYGVPATLFIGGHWAETHPAELQYLAQQPQFELGNHTYSHPHMVDLTPARQREELLWTQYLIYTLTGVMPRFYRPPYGELTDEMIYEAAKNGLYTVEFDLPAGDADKHVSLARLKEWIFRRATSGSIVIMHMNHPDSKTAAVLPSVIEGLRARGYRFAKVSDLLERVQQMRRSRSKS